MLFFLPGNAMTGLDYHVPEYTLVETREEIVIMIAAPLSKPKEAAFVLEENVFTFESSPYILKMTLPHPVSDRFSYTAYDCETKSYKIKLKKDFIITGGNTEIEDFDNSNSVTFSGEEPISTAECTKQFYGFANKYSNIFGKLYDEFSDVISLPNPDYTDSTERRRLREMEELEKWNDDHYLADTMETDHLDSIFNYKPPWVVSPVKDFNDDEKAMLGEIVNKWKVDALSEENVRSAELQVIDILFGYAYNRRTTEGENTVESGWTINKLSSTLSWLEMFEDLKALMVSCYRRSLVFPLYRNWKLAQMIQEDVVKILKAGVTQVTRSLLEVREIFNESENRYVLNNLYVNDLCNFAYHMTNERCRHLAETLKKVTIKKHEVSRDLPLLEIGAELVLEEEGGRYEGGAEARVREMVEKMAGLELDMGESESEESDSEGK